MLFWASQLSNYDKALPWLGYNCVQPALGIKTNVAAYVLRIKLEVLETHFLIILEIENGNGK